MGLGTFIAESPGKFLAMLGAMALGATVFLTDEPVIHQRNPWSLDPAQQHGPDRLAPLKDAIGRLGSRFGLRFGTSPPVEAAEPVVAAPVHRLRHVRGHRHRKRRARAGPVRPPNPG